MKKRGKNKNNSINKKNKRGIGKQKKAQEIFGLSFGMIFAMILIIFFVVMAIIAITSFLNFQKCAKIGIFLKDMKEKIDNAWNQGDASFEYKGNLPDEIQYACFVNLSQGEGFRGTNSKLGNELKTFNKKYNFFFYPPKESCDISGQIIPNINIPIITETENPYCIKVLKGKTSMMINMGDGDLVTITR